MQFLQVGFYKVPKFFGKFDIFFAFWSVFDQFWGWLISKSHFWQRSLDGFEFSHLTSNLLSRKIEKCCPPRENFCTFLWCESRSRCVQLTGLFDCSIGCLQVLENLENHHFWPFNRCYLQRLTSIAQFAIQHLGQWVAQQTFSHERWWNSHFCMKTSIAHFCHKDWHNSSFPQTPIQLRQKANVSTNRYHWNLKISSQFTPLMLQLIFWLEQLL